MAEALSKKVGGGKKGDPTKPKKEKKAGRTVFDYKTAVNLEGETLLSEDGKLTGIPHTLPGAAEGDDPVYAGWDPIAHKPLAQKDFATTDVFLDYRVHVLGIQIETKTAFRDKLAKRAEKLRKFGDESTRKKAHKLARMREQMAALEAELEADGVDLADV